MIVDVAQLSLADVFYTAGLLVAGLGSMVRGKRSLVAQAEATQEAVKALGRPSAEVGYRQPAIHAPSTTNPFSACFIRPGALTWVQDRGAPSLAELAQSIVPGGVYQVVAPHGAGKSTLLVHLAEQLRRGGRSAALLRIRGSSARWGMEDVLLVDEYESRNVLFRAAIRLLCGVRRTALIVACHRDLGFETLLQPQASFGLVQQLIGALASQTFLSDAELADLYARFAPNTRELLFALYDRFASCHAHPSSP